MINIDRGTVGKSIECIEELMEMDYNNTETLRSKEDFFVLYHSTALELLESLKSALEDAKEV